MSWLRSGEIMIMVIMGGIGTVFGSVFGAVGYLFAEEFLQDLVGRDYWMVVFGPMLVLLVLFARTGLFGFVPDRVGAYPAFHLRLNVFVVTAALFFWHLAVFPSIWIITTLIVIALAAKLAVELRERLDPPLILACGVAFIVACLLMDANGAIGINRAAPPLVADALLLVIYTFRRIEKLTALVVGLVCAAALVWATAVGLPLVTAIIFVVGGIAVAGGLTVALKSIVRGVGIATLVYFAAIVIAAAAGGLPLLKALSCITAVAYVLFTSYMVLLAGRDRLPSVGGRMEVAQHG